LPLLLTFPGTNKVWIDVSVENVKTGKTVNFWKTYSKFSIHFFRLNRATDQHSLVHLIQIQQYYDLKDQLTTMSEGYIKLAAHNYVSRAATIQGAQQVELKGRVIIQDGALLHGDMAPIRLARYVVVQGNSRIRPPSKDGNSTDQYVPVSIGSHTFIGKDCELQAAAIGSNCWIGNNVRLGERVIVKDNCVVADNSVVPDNTVIPPFTRIEPACQSYEYQWSGPRCWTQLPPSTAVELQDRSIDIYQDLASMIQ
jgi:dynactin-5